MMGSRGQAALYVQGEESGRYTVVRYALPWMLGVVVLLAGVLAHWAWGKADALPWITAVMALGTGGLSWLGWTVGRARHLGPAGRGQVAATVAAVGFWLLFAVVAGPFTRGVIDAWGLLGVGLAVSWNLRAGLHKPARSEDEDGLTTPRKAGKALLASVGVKGEDLVVKEVNENRIGGKLVLTSGNHTVEDVQKRRSNLAVGLGVPRAGVRFTENPDNAAEADFSFTLRDVLINPTPWSGPTHIGGTVFDPIPMGLYETGERIRKIIADKAGAKHELTQGASGSGKSSGTRIEICELMTRREVAIFMFDTKKATQAFGPAAPGLAWFITEDKHAAKVLRRIQTTVIKARTAWLGAHGLDAWVPGCGLTYLVLYIEEASGLFAEIGDSEVEDIAKAARSAGITLKISLQRPDYTQMSTTLRGQLGSCTCYGMASDDPVCLLPEAVQDAGADPQRWGDRMPGCCYVSGTGISIGQAATPARTFEITPDVLAAHAARYGPGMDPVDQVTIRAFGELWAQRIPPVELVKQINAAARSVGTPGVVKGEVVKSRELDDEEIETEVDEELEEEVGSLTPEEMGVIIEDGDSDGTTIDDSIESLGHEMTFTDPVSEVSPAEARAAVAECIDGFEAAGRDTIRVPDFSDLVVTVPRCRAWFRKELLRLAKAGRLVDEGGGEFRIVPGVIEDDDDSDEEVAA